MNRLATHPGEGFTFIELIIALAAISIFLAGAHSWMTNYTIRSKMAEAISIADTAKHAVVMTCAENPDLTALENEITDQALPTSIYVENVTMSGTCKSPVITVFTENTGLLVDPTFMITTNNLLGNGHPSWTCASDGLEIHVPKTCHI